MAGGVHQLLFYDYVPDILERREPHREAHLAHAQSWKADGRIVMAGALGDPPHGAAFVFRLDDAEAVRPFVEADPYVAAGLVTDWRVEPWKVV
jgi:uncharacterized protein YciI